MVKRRLWDPVNRVWCNVVPAGYTFQEWDADEDRLVNEVVRRSPRMMEALAKQTLESVGWQLLSVDRG